MITNSNNQSVLDKIKADLKENNIPFYITDSRLSYINTSDKKKALVVEPVFFGGIEISKDKRIKPSYILMVSHTFEKSMDAISELTLNSKLSAESIISRLPQMLVDNIHNLDSLNSETNNHYNDFFAHFENKDFNNVKISGVSCINSLTEKLPEYNLGFRKALLEKGKDQFTDKVIFTDIIAKTPVFKVKEYDTDRTLKFVSLPALINKHSIDDKTVFNDIDSVISIVLENYM